MIEELAMALAKADIVGRQCICGVLPNLKQLTPAAEAAASHAPFG